MHRLPARTLLTAALSAAWFTACAVSPPPSQTPPPDPKDMGGEEPGDMAIIFPDFPAEDMRPTTGDMREDPDMGPSGMDQGGGGEDMSEEDMTPPVQGDFPRAARVTQSGDRGTILLKGMVLTPEGPLEEGQVLIDETFIVCVGTDCESRPVASSATVIETAGIISPGLIDGHNHLPYNFLREWVPPAGANYTNRYQWADEESYEEFVRPLTAHRSSNSHFCPAARWGELRSLIHGTTTMMGQSFERTCTKGGVRNADHAHELQYDHMRTSIGSVRDINTSTAQGYIDSFDDPVEPITRFAVHMGEGYEGNNIEAEFDSFAGRDPRSIERHQGLSLLYKETAVLIHGVAITRAQLEEVKSTNSKIVWSPSSNMVLYGRTADIESILELGITTGLGPDWTISGEDHMLGELRFAHDWAKQNNASRVTTKKLWEMATSDGAEVVGLGEHVGVLKEGMTADVVVFTRQTEGGDPYKQIIDSRAKDVRLVLIDGEAYYGDDALKSALARRADCEAFDACGTDKFVCARYGDSDDYLGVSYIEGLLVDILEGNGYPADEQYKRASDLLPLVNCTE